MSAIQSPPLLLSRKQCGNARGIDHPAPANRFQRFPVAKRYGLLSAERKVHFGNAGWTKQRGAGCASAAENFLVEYRPIQLIGRKANLVSAAQLARLPVTRYKIIAFVICSMLAAVAGILDFSFIQTTQPNIGLSYTFPVFAAVIIGGARWLRRVKPLPQVRKIYPKF